jgi:hypothetical protein
VNVISDAIVKAAQTKLYARNSNMQIRTMPKAILLDGIYATWQEQILDGRIGTYAERLAINSQKPPTYQEQIQDGEILPYNMATKL